MGTPKGEGRSRGARSRGGERRRDNASQVVRSPQGAAGGAQPGRVGGPLAVEQAGVVDVHGATLEQRALDAGSGQSGRVAGEAEVAVSKSAEIAERVLQTIPQATLPGAEFPGAGSANSNYRADIVNVPPAAEPPKEGEPPRASRAGSRAHKERLEAASVLDAPASLHESVRPPAKESWVLRIWVAVMLAIIGSAGFVAWREQGARSAGGATATPSGSSATEGGDSQPREASPAQGAAGGALPPTNGKAAAAPETSAKPSEPSSPSPKAAEAATAVSAAHAGASPQADPTPEQLAAEEQARARRAARRAATGEPASSASVASQPKGTGAKAPEGTASGDSAAARAPTPPVSRDLGSASSTEPQLPQNPYDADEATEAP